MLSRDFLLAILTSALLFVSAFGSISGDSTAVAAEDPEKVSTHAARPFEPSEELTYAAEFSKLVLRNLDIAEFKFTAGRAPAAAAATTTTSATTTTASTSEPLTSQDQTKAAPDAAKPLLFTADVMSRGFFGKLFGINFHYRVESTVEPKTFSVLRTVKLDEQGKRVRTSEAVFDRVQNKISWTERDPNDPAREPRVRQNPLQGAAHDIITAIYFLRTRELKPGQNFEIVLSDAGEVYRVPVKVLAEKKKMKSVAGKLAVVRVEIGMFGAGRPVSDRKGEMTIWITDDARRLPVRAKISSDIGELNITLKKISDGKRS